MQRNKMRKSKEVKEKKNKTPPKAKPEKPQKEPKPPKIRDLRKLKTLRIVLYVVLIGVFSMGVLSIVRGDGTAEIKADMKSLAASMQGNISLHTEAQAFAQNFVKDYLTYENRQAEGYRKRLEQYCSPRLASEIAENIVLKDAADVVYVQAVDTAEYGANQYDITVMAEVLYTKYQDAQSYVPSAAVATTEGATTTPATTPEVPLDVMKKSTIYLIVPVWSDGQGGYTVEDMPMLTAPPKAAEYKRQEYSGTPADETDKVAAQQMLNDFFGALYTETQNKIDYYLAEGADKERFAGLNNSMTYEKIENLYLYKSSSANEYTGIVSIKIADVNGTELKQRFNVQLVKKDKFYAKDINLRTYNLV